MDVLLAICLGPQRQSKQYLEAGRLYPCWVDFHLFCDPGQDKFVPEAWRVGLRCIWAVLLDVSASGAQQHSFINNRNSRCLYVVSSSNSQIALSQVRS